MSELIDFGDELVSRARLANLRYLVVIEGDLLWGTDVALSFARHYSGVLWAGDSAPAAVQAIPLKKAKKLLGRECDCLVYNALQGLEAEALGALSGTIVGGGLLLMLVPPQWFAPGELLKPFTRRLARLLTQPDVVRIRQDRPLPVLPEQRAATLGYDDSEYGCLTAEQYEAVAAIRRVVTGHRKRPFVVTADRGRGKSSALGIAAASLMRERTIHIGVTAPAFANADTLFSHVARRLNLDYDRQKQLSFADSQLQFYAPDRLLAEKVPLDFLIVDEAAAIPAPMLARLLGQYNRIAFASTVHGYEGTGRGFAIKFRQQLDVITPQWRQLRMTQPIRWADNDPLERWVFRALLLDAEYADLGVQPAISATVRYRVLPTNMLVDDEPMLSQLFGLLVNAHYQTSPADIVQLLDDERVHLLVAESGEQVVGCCLLNLEGGFGEALAREVLLGRRRPKGHLLAQSVAAHIGIEQAALQRCARIMRIAVHPEWQQRAIGLSLLALCRQWAEEQQLEYLGTSFGLVPELFDFWQKAGYSAVRLGVSKDAASGTHSLLAVLPLSPAANRWHREATALFAANFQSQRFEQFSELDCELFYPLYRFALSASAQPLPAMTALSERQLRIYAAGGLGYDLVVSSLEAGLILRFNQLDKVPGQQLKFVIAKVLQRQAWSKVVADYGFAGRKMAEQALREFVACYLITAGSHSARN